MGTSKHRLLARLGSLLVILSVLAAPLCATRCTLSSCFQENSHHRSEPGCHHQSAQSDTASSLAAAPEFACVPTDSFLTALPAQQQRLLLTASNHDSSWLSANQNAPFLSLASDLVTLRILIRDSSPGDSFSLLPNTPLRL